MINYWQLTATTIHCDAIDEEVTIIVSSEWKTTCTGFKKYGENTSADAARALLDKSNKIHKPLACEGPTDFRITDYVAKLMREQSEVNFTNQGSK
jgi:hypothetical protein